MDDPRMEGNGVWLPLPLAMAMMECYFGGGRRHREPPPETPAPEDPSPGREELPQAVARIKEWAPRGFAARRASSAVQSPQAPPVQE